MIVNIVETFNGIRAVQAFRREKRNDAIFAELNGAYPEANRETFRLHALFIPGTSLVGNMSTVAGAARSAATGSPTAASNSAS